MKLNVCALIVAMVCLVSPVMAAEQLKVNSEKSKLISSVRKPMGSTKVAFKKITGEGVADHDEPEKGSLKLTIDTKSIWSDDAKLNDHLKGPDFFEVDKYPTITFESTRSS